MTLAAQIFAGIAALLHVLFFYLESIAFKKNGTYKSFGVANERDAEAVAPMALNQGFYNLFLAIGVFVGIALYRIGDSRPTDGEFVTKLGSIEDQGGFQGDPILGVVPDYIGINSHWGEAFVVFGTACMLGAAIVLLISSKGKLLRGVVIQGLAPLIALLLIAFA